MSESPMILMTPDQVAAFLGMSKAWLAKKRMTGDGPPFVRFGRAIRYIKADLEPWVMDRRTVSTSDPDLYPAPFARSP